MIPTAILGAGQTKFTTRRPDVSAPELATEAAELALADAGVDWGDIDAVVFASGPDAFEGVHEPDKWCTDSIGAVGKPLLRIHTGGATGGSGAHAGFYHVASGLFDTVLVVAVQRVGETPDAQLILNSIWDPIFEVGFPLNIINACAFQASRKMQKDGLTEEQMALVSVKNHGNAMRNSNAHLRFEVTLEDVLASRVLCWPIKLLEACPRSDGACAIVVASERVAAKVPRPAWIQGVASVTDAHYMGDRIADVPYPLDYDEIVSLYLAARRAYKMAGIQRPAEEIQVAELYAPFTYLEIIASEAVGLCPRGQGGQYVAEGRTAWGGPMPINPSGGVLCANPIGATGLVRVAELAAQVRGTAGDHQVPDVRRGIATAFGGTCQFSAVTVLGREKP